MQRSQQIIWVIVGVVVVAIIIFAGVFYSREGSHSQVQVPASTQPSVTVTTTPSNASPTVTPKPKPKPVAPKVTSVSPQSVSVSSIITISGSGFLPTNTVLFNGLVANQAATLITLSGGKQILSVPVPTSLTPNCASVAQQACPMIAYQTIAGNYKVSVQNANGTSNAVDITVR